MEKGIFDIGQIWVQFLILLLISCVSLVKLINLSERPILISNTVYFADGCGDLVSKHI